MNRNYLPDIALVGSFLISFSATMRAEENGEVLYSSPSDAFRIERNGEDAWVISTKDPTQRAKVPPLEGISPVDDEYHSSPNDARLFQRGPVPSCRSATHQDCADRERSIVQRSGLAILCKARRAESELFRGRRWRGHGSDRFRGVEFRFEPAPRAFARR